MRSETNVQGKISLKSSKLVRFCKNKYHWDSCLTALEGNQLQSAIQPAEPVRPPLATAPSSLSYDQVAHFCRRACQGCNMSAGIKLLVNSAYEDKTLSIIWTNCVIKVVKDKKTTKMTKMTTDFVVAFIASV
jgi:hypothetical protein